MLARTAIAASSSVGCSSYMRQMSADHGRRQMPVGRGDAQQLGDDRDRQRLGDVGDQVELPGPSPSLDQPVHQALHRLAHRFDHPRRERLGDQPANPRVVGRFHVQDAVGDQMPERLVAAPAGPSCPISSWEATWR